MRRIGRLLASSRPSCRPMPALDARHEQHDVQMAGTKLFSTAVTREEMGLSSNETSQYNPNTTWKKWFNSPEYINAWSDDIEPLNGAPVLDGHSRMVLDLLNRMYQIGLTKTNDRVTTERVHTILQQLEDWPAKTTTSESIWQRAERGRVLLEAMEKFEEFRDVPHLPLTLPLPTHETYWRVLRIYSSKFLSGWTAKNHDVPAICRGIVQRMQDSGRLELQPSVLHWNQVLCAHANSNKEKRSLQAAELLYELERKGMADASSFSHALRACSALTVRDQKSTPEFVELAIPVAQRIWTGLKKSKSASITSYHFSHMLRVFRPVHDNARRDALVKTIFMEAIEAQKVNVYVLKEFLQVASSTLVSQLLGKSKYSKDVATLIQELPSEWIEPVEKSRKIPHERESL